LTYIPRNYNRPNKVLIIIIIIIIIIMTIDLQLKNFEIIKQVNGKEPEVNESWRVLVFFQRIQTLDG